MLIKEVPKDAELTIEVSAAARKLEFKSQCIDTGMNYLYARPIIIDGKRVSFEASVTLSVSLVYIREDKNPVLWRGVGISTVTENGKSMYKITSSVEGYEMNRRQAFRLFLGLGAVAQIGINKKAVNVILKDISENGFSFVGNEDIEVNKSPVRLVFKDTDETIFQKYPKLTKGAYYYYLASLAPNKNLSWILKNAAGNPDKIYGVADSGGAYLLTNVAAMTKNKKFAKAAHTKAPDFSLNALGLISGMFYTTRFDKIGLFLPSYLYGKGYKKKAIAPYVNIENPEIVSALPPCFLVTSHSDNLEHYTVKFEKALKANRVSHKLLRFGKNKKLTHAFSVFEPFYKESTKTLKSMHEYFQSF